MLTFGSTFSIPPWRLIALLVFWRLWQVWSMLMLWSLLARSLSSWCLVFRFTPSWWFTCSKVRFILSWQDLMLSTSLIREFSTPSLTISIPFLPSLRKPRVFCLLKFYRKWPIVDALWVYSHWTFSFSKCSFQVFSHCLQLVSFIHISLQFGLKFRTPESLNYCFN